MPKLKVIIADEDPMVCYLCRNYISGIYGFTVTSETHSLSSLKRELKNLTVDLVLLDAHMDKDLKLDGFKGLRSAFPRVDFIVMAKTGDPFIIRNVICQGAFDCLIKPFSFKRLESSLKAYRTYNLGLTTRDSPWNQEELDKMMSELANTKVHPLRGDLPKGIQEKLLEKVIRCLEQSNKALSAKEIGGIVGISRATARRYLEYLLESKLVSVEYPFTKIGRPKKLYKLVQKQ
ncbi:response regulator receiver and unknown domain protein (plasmid) [Thermovirga lienii DSM 17291]|uniref:Response regulatory domain-containing protein n=1 Tax=Thermovirga lienii (strain ATCC BAA-1197 / DSM 17291 / Cas60314) TaxID=580340 RepID=G7VAE7_THELD|nr:response regulator [Thermovirga lienii]AER67597.1 response regulator receiver and unknown domain protein [Thermovirga lienii DSM 17291]MDN5368294.1 two-component system, CitB family, response regulator DctR [Thermovirga sp.]